MYKFKTSEQNNDKATEFETKSLLYLLTKIKGHSGISLFIIDCFNDVTGVAEDYSDSWDMFCIWKQNESGDSVFWGDYSPNYEYVKEAFAVRSGLVSKDRLFSENRIGST